MKKINLWSASVLFVFAVVPPCLALAGDPLSISGVGIYSLGPGAPEGLSGITYAGTNQYYAVNDSGALMYPLTINLNATSGAISSASVGSSVTLAGTDLEGMAYDAPNNSLYVSDETGATVKEYNLSGGNLSTVNVPTIFASYRTNYSLESLSMRADGLQMWSANEEALYDLGTGVDDGPLSTTLTGTIIRLQRFTRTTVGGSWTANGQWAYHTDPISGTPTVPTGLERSGVSDLCVLPNGKLLVLERELGGSGTFPDFRNRIYEVDHAGATDVSAITSLNGAVYTPVSKSMLWGGDFLTDNFEGLCLGPQLDNGAYSLLMVSDGDGPASESLYSLQLGGEVPEPATLGLLGLAAFCLLVFRRRK